jgi:endonuclease YncB( thermonuclease family)
MLKNIALSVAILFLVFGIGHAWRGRVINVIDGDTIIVSTPQEKKTVKLAGIDAPDEGQPYYEKARERLAELIRGRVVELIDEGENSVTIPYGTFNVSEIILMEGYAWYDGRSGLFKNYENLEIVARSLGSGLWADRNSITPQEYRYRKATDSTINYADESLRPPVSIEHLYVRASGLYGEPESPVFNHRGEKWSARVVGVIDGDTIIVNNGATKRTVRLSDIDAPEMRQLGGRAAKEYLSNMIIGKAVKIEGLSTDDYGRMIGRITVDEKSVNGAMIASGNAWHYKKYSKDLRLSEMEAVARRNRVGLWADSDPMAPWELR